MSVPSTSIPDPSKTDLKVSPLGYSELQALDSPTPSFQTEPPIDNSTKNISQSTEASALEYASTVTRPDRNSFQNPQLLQLRAQIMAYRILDRKQPLPLKITMAISGGIASSATTTTTSPPTLP